MADKELTTFTPYVKGYDKKNPLRAYMQISKEDRMLIDTLPRRKTTKTVEVFDEVSQRSYVIRTAGCGLNCYCGAVIVRNGNRREKHY